MVLYRLDVSNHTNISIDVVGKVQEKKYQILKNGNTFIVIAHTDDGFAIYGDDNLLTLCNIMKTYLKSNANNFIIGMIFARNINGFILSNYLSKFKFLLLSVFGYLGSFLFPVSREYIVKYHYCNDMHKCMKNYKGLK